MLCLEHTAKGERPLSMNLTTPYQEVACSSRSPTHKCAMLTTIILSLCIHDNLSQPNIVLREVDSEAVGSSEVLETCLLDSLHIGMIYLLT
jgi:hypothetical protein